MPRSSSQNTRHWTSHGGLWAPLPVGKEYGFPLSRSAVCHAWLSRSHFHYPAHLFLSWCSQASQHGLEYLRQVLGIPYFWLQDFGPTFRSVPSALFEYRSTVSRHFWAIGFLYFEPWCAFHIQISVVQWYGRQGVFRIHHRKLLALVRLLYQSQVAFTCWQYHQHLATLLPGNFYCSQIGLGRSSTCHIGLLLLALKVWPLLATSSLRNVIDRALLSVHCSPCL